MIHNLKGNALKHVRKKVKAFQVPKDYEIIGVRVSKKADYSQEIPICGLVTIKLPK